MKTILSPIIKTARLNAGRWFVAAVLLYAACTRAAEPAFTNVTATVAPGLPKVQESSVSWADFDGDGRLDFLITGYSTVTVSNATEGVYNGIFPISQLWRNTDSGFTNVTAMLAPGLPGVWKGSVAWGDYDNDGRLDFLLTGYANGYGDYVSQLWRNTGGGFTNVTATVAPGLPGVGGGSVAWGDYDNDGRLDFLITGHSGYADGNGIFISQIWRNTGSGFTNMTDTIAPGLPGVYAGSVAWGDYDNDGRLDFLLTGGAQRPHDQDDDGDYTPIAQLWRNTGSGFDNVTITAAPGLPGVHWGAVAWADYDNDGRLDFLISGWNRDTSTRLTQLWRNTENGFMNVTATVAPGLPQAYFSSLAWGDYDNDGRLDFLITGLAPSGIFSQVWRNTGNGFTNVTASVAPGLAGVVYSSVAWGDYDNDGRLDFLLTGATDDGCDVCDPPDAVSQLWRNTTTNSPPSLCVAAPAGLVGWWRGDGDAGDSVGFHESYLSTGVGFGAGHGGQGFVFGASNGGVQFPAAEDVDVGAGAGLSLELWINPAVVSGNVPLVEWNNGSWWGAHFFIVEGRLYANLVDTDGGWRQLFSSSGDVVPNQWQHVGLTYDKATGRARMYLNGNIVADEEIGTFTPDTRAALYFGRRPAGDIVVSYKGLMDEVSLYDRALSAQEIHAIHAAGLAGKCTTSLLPALFAVSPVNRTPTSMILVTTINVNGHATTGWFIWGTTTNYGQATAPQSIAADSSYSTYSQILTGLSAGVTYYFRAVVSNDLGHVVFGIKQHIVLAEPAVATYHADNLTPTSARLLGVGYPNGLPTYGWFEWGTTPAFGQRTPVWFLGGQNGGGVYIGDREITGLAGSTTYYFRAVVSNSVATMYGETQSLVTPSSNICASYINPSRINHGYGATTGTISVGGAPTNCSWTVVNTNSWITIRSGPSGQGNGSVIYSIEANPGVLPRIGNITVAGWNFALIQAGHSDVSLPADQVVALGGTASFSVTVNVTPPFTCRWQFNGVNLVDGGGISGATTTNLVLTDVQYSQAGHYRCVVKNSYFSSSATLTVAPTSDALSIAEAADTEDMFFWKTWSDSSGIWFGQTDTTHDGVDAVEVSGLAPGQFASVETKSGGPGLLSFWWKTDFAASSDNLRFWIGSAQSASLFESTDWEQRSFTVPPGDVNLRWTFSNSGGAQNKAWLDQVQFTPCDFRISAPANTFPSLILSSLGYTSTVTVTAAADCPWHVVNTNSWITILSSVTNHGSGSVTFVVAANGSPVNRVGYIVIADLPYSIYQGSGSPANNPAISLPTALDTEGLLVWDTIGTPAWFGQTTISRDGVDAAQSGPVGDSGAVTATTSVDGPGTVFFWWKVSSETNKDYLKFFINGVQQTRISGEVDWQLVSYDLTSETNMLKWTYSKNDKAADGNDRGWLDQIQFIPAPGNCFVAISPIGAAHSANSATGTVSVVTGPGCAWDVVNTNAWITYSVDSGEGNGVVRYTVSANDSRTPRTGVMLIGGRPFTVTQVNGLPPCTYSISPSNRSLGYVAATGTIAVTTPSGCEWNVFNTNAWITITPDVNHSGSAQITYSVSANPLPVSRSGQILIGDKVFSITQLSSPGPTLDEALDIIGTPLVLWQNGYPGWVGQSSVTHDGVDAASTASGSFTLTVNGPGTLTFWWKASSPTNSNLRLYVAGSEQTRITGEVNWEQRTVFIPAGNQALEWYYAKSGTNPLDRAWLDQVQFTPASLCPVTLSSGGTSFSSSFATGFVSVAAAPDCYWYVFNTNSWITTVSGTNGTGNGSVTYVVSTNPTASVRSGNVRIADKVFLVTQSGGTNPPPSCTISILPGSRTHGYSSVSNTVLVSAQTGCPWTVVTTNSWISIHSSLNNLGSGTVSYFLALNPNPDSRSGNVLIGNQVFHLTQSGAGTNAPRLQIMGRPGTNATLFVQGGPGKMYVVECSEDLDHWIPISTNSASSTVTDTAPGNPHQRFYRTVEVP